MTNFPIEITLTLIPNSDQFSKIAVAMPSCKSFFDGQQVGSNINDNCWESDGYRFHDILHLGLFAEFGWSPVLLKMMKLKNTNDRKIYEFEEGPRAVCADEGICLLVFNYAKERSFDIKDENLSEIILAIKSISYGLLSLDHSCGDWSNFIHNSIAVVQKIKSQNGGTIIANRINKTLITV